MLNLQNSLSPTVFVFLLNELIVFCFPPTQSGHHTGPQEVAPIIEHFPGQQPAASQ